jgi:cytochrome b561
LKTEASSQTARYTVIAILLHWLIAVLILGLLVMGFVMSALPFGSPFKFPLFQWHKSFGILVLLLSLLRLGWRLRHPPPPLPAGSKLWEKILARGTHWAFYGLMLGMPLVGWLAVSASSLGIPTILFGLVPWPHLPFFRNNDAAAGILFETHEGCWSCILALPSSIIGSSAT